MHPQPTDPGSAKIEQELRAEITSLVDDLTEDEVNVILARLRSKPPKFDGSGEIQ